MIDIEIGQALWNGQVARPCPWSELNLAEQLEWTQLGHIARLHLRIDQDGVQRSRDG